MVVILKQKKLNANNMSSTKLFRKHFGDQSPAVDLKHPNMEKFFSELNVECLLEDKQKQCNHTWMNSGMSAQGKSLMVCINCRKTKQSII